MSIYLEIVAAVALFGFVSALFTRAIGPSRPKPYRPSVAVSLSGQFTNWAIAMIFIGGIATVIYFSIAGL